MTEVPLTTTEISEQVKRRAKPVNQGYSLDAYFAVADSTGVTVRQRARPDHPHSQIRRRRHPAISNHDHIPLTTYPRSHPIQTPRRLRSTGTRATSRSSSAS